MSLLLSLVAVAFGLLYLRHCRETRRQWRKLESILAALHEGKRPATFIMHGEQAGLGLGLEKLADERDRLRQQVREEEFNLQAVLASVDDGVVIVDTARRIRLVNNAFLRLFPGRGEMVGQTLLQALRDAAVEETTRKALGSRKTVSREVAFGSTTLLVNACPMQRHDAGAGEDGSALLGAAIIFRDITRMTQLEQVRRDFVANVSHELRTPLSIFQGYVEMLLDAPDLSPGEVRGTLDILQKHSRRLNLLVEDLLSIARLESRREALTLEPVSLGKVLGEMAPDWHLKFSARRVAFRLVLPESLPPVMACELRLEQIVNNLLENALNYTPEGGEVSLEAERVGTAEGERAAVEIRVRDTGSGIPAKDLPHIFERFYRADKARQRGQGGTGLGLSIVKHLVQAHGGSVHAESLPGRGTTIAFRLPASVTLEPVRATARQRDAGAGSNHVPA